MDTERLRAAMMGPGGLPLRVAHRGTTRSQLAALAVYDRYAGPRRTPAERAVLAERATMVVKTFQRPATAHRLVRSARRVFDGQIIVVDDSRTPMVTTDPGVRVIPMPFNSGVSAGRNVGLDAVDTEFVFVTDDDIVFTGLSDIAGGVAYLDDNPAVHVVGMTLVELPRWRVVRQDDLQLFAGHRPLLRPQGELIDGLPVQAKIAQVFLARTAAIQRVRWNENVRMIDHKDFFSRASGELVVVLDEGMRAYHARTPFDADYAAYREDVAADIDYLLRAWSRPGLPDPRPGHPAR